ncbi:hypothetical protein QY702_04580 [Xanthomonas campestris pv. plantaginis]|uniref:hypothetical protein n=1 Tax=Xanthomonas campestris TaxID=339 RepID=UPI002B2265BD|nr:hypothetical protein [Xanthomonas campestris]MEA9605744.1 hypothetical protein [Xanthomonas campestris pv. plantaginis]
MCDVSAEPRADADQPIDPEFQRFMLREDAIFAAFFMAIGAGAALLLQAVFS